MLRGLAIFALTFFVFPVQAHSQPNEAQKTHNRTNPSPAASPIVPEQSGSQSAQTEPKKHVDADVRIVSAPGKDGYDRAAFWMTFALVVIGSFGIGVGIATLFTVKRQADLFASKERARLSVGFSPFEHRFGDQNPHVTAVVTNHGGTNAFIHAGSCEVCVRPSHSKLVRSRDSFYGIPKVVEAGESKRAEIYQSVNTGKSGVWVMDNEIFESLRCRQANIFAYGYVEYSDVFGSRWILNFSRRWGGDYSVGQWFFIHEWPDYGTREDNSECEIKNGFLSNLRKLVSRVGVN